VRQAKNRPEFRLLNRILVKHFIIDSLCGFLGGITISSDYDDEDILMFKAQKHLMATGILAVSLLFGCSGNLMQGEKVATVNNEVITKREYQEHLDRTILLMQLNPAEVKKDEGNPLYGMFQRMTMQKLILSHLVKQEAEKRHLKVTPEEEKAVIDKQVAEAGGEKALDEDLKKLGLNRKDFQVEITDQLLRDKVVKAVAGDKYKVTEGEAKAYYDANAVQFDEKEKVRARHILVSADPQQVKQEIEAKKKGASAADIQKEVDKTLAEKKQKAEQLLQQVKANPAQFESIAQKSSDDKGSAKNGGDLGYFSQEAMVPPFSMAAFSTKPGQIHEGIVQSPFGFHVIQVVDRKAAGKLKFDNVKDKIILVLENQRKGQIMKDWIEEQKKQAKIEIVPEYDPDKMAKLLPKDAPNGSPEPQKTKAP
jgi:peptidyl-prolyl cis-trans isomerase C